MKACHQLASPFHACSCQLSTVTNSCTLVTSWTVPLKSFTRLDPSTHAKGAVFLSFLSLYFIRSTAANTLPQAPSPLLPRVHVTHPKAPSTSLNVTVSVVSPSVTVTLLGFLLEMSPVQGFQNGQELCGDARCRIHDALPCNLADSCNMQHNTRSSGQKQ